MGRFTRAYIVFMVNTHRRTHVHTDKWADRTGKLGISYEITRTQRELQSSTWSADDIKVTSSISAAESSRTRWNLAFVL